MTGLTALAVKSAEPRDKVYSLSDGRGLLLEVHPSGRKYWIVRIRNRGREARRCIGSFPDVSLKEARDLAVEFKANPGLSAKRRSLGVSFAEVAQSYLEACGNAPNTVKRDSEILRVHVLPFIGGLPLADVSYDDVADVCDRIVRRGLYDSAVKARGVVSCVFRWAMVQRLVRSNPAAGVLVDTRGYKERHYAAVSGSAEVGALMRAVSGYRNFVVRAGLLCAAYSFCRPSEVAGASWREFDLSRAVWVVPAERMKLRRAHFVPLCRQLVEVLGDLKRRNLSSFVFPSARCSSKPMSAESLRAALRVMGFSADEMTTHGFRSIASTTLNEFGWPFDVVELQLSHGERDAVRGAYNRAQHVEERTAMMQWYADYLDAVRDGLPVPRKPTITITL